MRFSDEQVALLYQGAIKKMATSRGRHRAVTIHLGRKTKLKISKGWHPGLYDVWLVLPYKDVGFTGPELLPRLIEAVRCYNRRQPK